MNDSWLISPDEFRRSLRAAGLWRGYIITDPAGGEVRASHPLFEGFAQQIARDERDYHRHEALFFEVGRESDHLMTAFLHRTRRGQGAGGVRFWTYDTMEGVIRDGLRLSRGMGHKNALAGLWWGGGKGVIVRRDDRDHRDPVLRGAIFRDYGRFVTGLAGAYVTAEDVGTRPEDMAWVFRTTRFTTCIPRTLGGSGNPSVLTARGVVVAMESALEFLGSGSLAGKTIAMQGLGNVSSFMIADLLERKVGRIVANDIDEGTVEQRRAQFAGAAVEFGVVARDDVSIFGEPADVFAPNAVGGSLNRDTIPLLQCAIVCGAANNQLEDPHRDAQLLADRGILYVPDFLANRMGIVNCANEQYGVVDGDAAIAMHLDRDAASGVFRRAQDVFSRARDHGVTTAAAAQSLAEELSDEVHPIWGHRGRAIVEHLRRSGWDRGEPVASEESEIAQH